ncbi:MAG: signal peptidase II [Elusimicrobiaceae bacterium]|nr:signal peptidase II [Elusimicrobiaceae bacterium]
MKQSVSNAVRRVRTWAVANPGIIGGVVAVLTLDRVSKVLAQTFLVDGPVVVWPFFHLHYVENTGAAFGMMQGGNLLLIFVMLGIIGYLLHSWKEICAQGVWAKWGSVLILAGALGNLYDRIRLGYVVDFLDFLVWPVFNVADTAITLGGCCFVISLLTHWKHQREEK